MASKSVKPTKKKKPTKRNKPACAVFILTHKRPDNQKTLATLRESGYTGKIYLVCDTKDPTLDQYKEMYGDMVLVFSKAEYRKKFDLMTNDTKDNAVVFARNAVYDLAKQVGLDYVIVLDDDYSVFYINIDKTCSYQRTRITNLDRVFSIHLKLLIKSKLDVLAFAQGGDFVGGWDSNIAKSGFQPRRKAMNAFFFDVNNPVQFNGLINEDSTMAVQLAAVGRKVLTNCLVQLEQSTTQETAGGLTDIYKDLGTYQKSFYTVMASPSSVKVMYQRAVGRVHHLIQGNGSYPKIVSEDLKK